MNKLVAILFLKLCFLSCNSCQKKIDLSVNSVEELEKKLNMEFERNDLVSISYCLVKDDQILYSGALGYANKANNQLATDNTRYLVASVSKTITAVAAMKLVEQNLIDLDDDINQYLPFTVKNPSFPNDKITLRMLLSHRSSIIDEYQENFDLYCFGSDCQMSLSEYFNQVFQSTGLYYSSSNFSNYKPGTKEDYSNLGSALVGFLVERVTSIPFDEYCKNHIFIPLEMTKTEWRLANIPQAELAIPYSNEITSSNPHYTFPDYPNGGLRTTVLDISKFLRMIIQNGTFNGVQVLSSASMATMKTLQFGSDEFCLSFYYDTVNGRKVLGHSGGEMGATAEMFYDTKKNIGVIVFSNEEDANLENIMTLLFNYGDTK